VSYFIRPENLDAVQQHNTGTRVSVIFDDRPARKSTHSLRTRVAVLRVQFHPKSPSSIVSVWNYSESLPYISFPTSRSFVYYDRQRCTVVKRPLPSRLNDLKTRADELTFQTFKRFQLFFCSSKCTCFSSTIEYLTYTIVVLISVRSISVRSSVVHPGLHNLAQVPVQLSNYTRSSRHLRYAIKRFYFRLEK